MTHTPVFRPLDATPDWPALLLQRHADWQLRAETDADRDFLERLYAHTRVDELAPVPWTDAQKQAFLAEQFALQHAQYLQHYPGAAFLLMEHRGVAAGRIYLHRGAHELRLMDMALLSHLRNQGIGSALMQGLVAWCDANALALTLHVEPFNPAYRLYRRCGLTWQRSTGVYHFLERAPGMPSQADVISPWPQRTL